MSPRFCWLYTSSARCRQAATVSALARDWELGGGALQADSAMAPAKVARDRMIRRHVMDGLLKGGAPPIRLLPGLQAESRQRIATGVCGTRFRRTVPPSSTAGWRPPSATLDGTRRRRGPDAARNVPRGH